MCAGKGSVFQKLCLQVLYLYTQKELSLPGEGGGETIIVYRALAQCGAVWGVITIPHFPEKIIMYIRQQIWVRGIGRY